MRYTVLFFVAFLALPSCNTVQEAWSDLNLFSVQDDIALGKQVSNQIESDTSQFNVLPEQGNQEIYNYVQGLMQQILNTGRIKYAEEFPWEIKIINNPETLNAFATPGGHLYIYTGLMKYLDTEDQLMGVIGHEIAHSDQRHSTSQMSKMYGADILRRVITGESSGGALQQIALQLASLKFSRSHETEADEYSVYYLCQTPHNAAGAAGFFKKMAGQGSPPEFLSTHPDPGDRVNHIQNVAEKRGCSTEPIEHANYDRVKDLIAALPTPPPKEEQGNR